MQTTSVSVLSSSQTMSYADEVPKALSKLVFGANLLGYLESDSLLAAAGGSFLIHPININ